MLRKFLSNYFFFIFLFEILFTSTSLGVTSSNGLTDDMQFKLVTGLFDSKLYYSAEIEAKTYLDQFPSGKFLETIIFLKARASEQLTQRQKNEEIQLKKLEEVIKQYRNYRKKYPKGQWIEETMFSEGYLNVQLHRYKEAIGILESFIDTYPKNKNKDHAFYWIGSAAFNRAAQVQKKQSLDVRPIYQKVITALTKITNNQNLSEEQQTNRMFLLGWSYQYQQKPDKAKKYLSEYNRRTEGSPNTVRILYQLGQNAWNAKQYDEAIRHFDKVLKFPDSELYPLSLFAIAEIKHTLFLEKPSSKTTNITSIISLYNNYLKTNDSSQQATTYYRLGTLYSRIENHQKAVDHFQLYLKSDDTSGRSSVQQAITYFRLSRLYLVLNKSDQSIDHFEKYLKSNDQTYAATAYFELGKLYVKKGKNQKAIVSLKRAKQSEQYQNNTELFQLLIQLLEEVGQNQEKQKLLREVTDNSTLSDQERLFFLIKVITSYFENDQCKEILEELGELPKTNKPEEKKFFLFARGQCFIQTNQWERATADLELVKDDPMYEKPIFPLLIIAYQQLGNEDKLVAHLEDFQQRDQSGRPIEFFSSHFEILLNAYQQSQNWEKARLAYTRWESKYPKEVQTPAILISWAQTEEKLQNIETSKNLYEKALSLILVEEAEGHPMEGEGPLPRSIEFREQVLNYLVNLYVQDDDYESVVRIYEEQLIPHLTQTEQRQKYALLLGKMYYAPLKNYKKARLWLRQADLGQTIDIDLEASVVLSAVELDDKQLNQAIAVLLQVTTRKLQNTSWKLKVYHRLATLYERQSQWQQALNNHKIAALYSRINNDEDKELQENSKQRIEEIEIFLANEKLNEFINQKLWKEVAQFIKEMFNKQRLKPSNELYETLIFSENENQNWQGVLEAYNQWEKLDSAKVETYEAFLTRGQAAENLSKKGPAKKYYLSAWSLVPPKDLNTRIFLTERLGLIYAQEKDYKKVVYIYQKTYPFLKKKADQVHFSYTIANYYLDPLNQNKQAKIWFQKTDQGGISEEELSAVWNLAEMDKQKSPKQAIKILRKMASRPLSKKPRWYILINYSLGLLYHNEEVWKKAIIHYNRVAKAPKLNEYKQYQQDAKEKSKAIKQYLKDLKRK